MQVPGEMCSRQSALHWRKDFFIMLTPTWAVPSTSGEVCSQAFPHCQGDSHTRADICCTQRLCPEKFAPLGSAEQAVSTQGSLVRASGHLRGRGDW